MNQVLSHYTDFESPLGLQMSVWKKWDDEANTDFGGIGSFMYEEWQEFGIDHGLTDKQIDQEYESHYGKFFGIYPKKFDGLTEYSDSFNVEINVIESDPFC